MIILNEQVTSSYSQFIGSKINRYYGFPDKIKIAVNPHQHKILNSKNIDKSIKIPLNEK